MNTLHSDVDSFRATLADTRANIQQMQRDIAAIKERIDETRVQVGRQLGQTNREGRSTGQKLGDSFSKTGGGCQSASRAPAEPRGRAQAATRINAEPRLGRQSAPGDGLNDLSLAESENVRKDYESAWRAYEKKDYRVAINRFKDFLKKKFQEQTSPECTIRDRQQLSRDEGIR